MAAAGEGSGGREESTRPALPRWRDRSFGRAARVPDERFDGEYFEVGAGFFCLLYFASAAELVL